MKKIIPVLILLSMVLALFCGCGTNAQDNQSAGSAAAAEEPTAPATQTVTDTMGRTVTLNADVQKIIAVPWPWSSFVFAVDGSAEKISTMSATALASYKNCMFQILAPGLADSDTDFIDDANKDGGSFGTLNVEELIKVNPDVVIIYKRDAEAMLPILETAGIPTLVFDFGGLKEVQDGLRILGQILGDDAAERADQIIAWHEETEALLGEKLKNVAEEDKPSALILNSNTLALYNSEFSNNMLLTAGCRLAATDDGALPTSAKEVSFEQLLAWDPDYIFLTNFFDGKPDDIYNNLMADQNWSQLKAVKNHHVYKIPMGIYRWSPPSTEAHLFLTWLATIFHPELMQDVSLTEMTKEFYSTLFGYDLTEADLNMIYQTELNQNSESVPLDGVK